MGWYMEATNEQRSLLCIPVLILCILVDFPIHIDIISVGLLIVYFKGSQIEFTTKDGPAHCVL